MSSLSSVAITSGERKRQAGKCKCRKLAGHGGDFRRHCGHFNFFSSFSFSRFLSQALQRKKFLSVSRRLVNRIISLSMEMVSFKPRRKSRKFSARGSRFLIVPRDCAVTFRGQLSLRRNIFNLEI